MDEANGLCTDRNGSDGYAFSTLNESTLKHSWHARLEE